MHQQALAVEKLDSAKRSPDQAHLPVRTANASLWTIGETQNPIRTHSRRDFTLADGAIDPFDIFDLTEQAGGEVDADGRHWPRLPDFSRDRINELESTVENLHKELSVRCIQIADLHNVQRQQAAALLMARNAIRNLENSALSLQKTITQREYEVAVAKQELLTSVQEKNALSEKLEDTEKEFARLLQKLLLLSATLNEKEKAIVPEEERVTALEQELTADTMQEQQEPQEPAALPAPVVEEVREQYRDETDDQSIQCESQHEKPDSDITLEPGHTNAHEKLQSLAINIKFLETALRAGREIAEQRIAELTSKLRRERDGHSLAKRESATFRREIALQLSKLAKTTRSIQRSGAPSPGAAYMGQSDPYGAEQQS